MSNPLGQVTPEQALNKINDYVKYGENHKDEGTSLVFIQNMGLKLPIRSSKSPFVVNVFNAWSSFDLDLYKKYIKSLLINSDMFEVSNFELRNACRELQKTCAVFNLNKNLATGVYMTLVVEGKARFVHLKGFPLIPTYDDYLSLSRV